MHIVFDDQNIEDHSIVWSSKNAQEHCDILAMQLAEAMLKLTWEERCYVVDIEDPAAFKEEIEAV